jgi:hypothetical protein
MTESSIRLSANGPLWQKNLECKPHVPCLSMSHLFLRETKTINAWFQNKRASSKKRTRSVAHSHDPPAGSSLNLPVSTGSPQQSDLHEFTNETHPKLDPHSSLLMSIKSPQQQTFFAGNPEHKHIFAESERIPRRLRVRPSHEQTEELKRLYKIDPHPTKEEREELGDRIGM